MNIFVLDKDPKKSARILCDQHVVKMILESAQLLCTAHHCTNPKSKAPYKKTHVNHPCSIWTRTSEGNYNWLVAHADELCKEYTKRYNREHKTKKVIEWCKTKIPKLEKKRRTSFVQAMPEKYKNIDSFKAYEDYYKGEKLKFARWKRGKPEQFK
ncbi:hypothetical protein J4481_02740 [Candidatus Pacearchaeota archaeon]|nr:hypothetical protein [Candidatus Pacearchaeota archaeon]